MASAHVCATVPNFLVLEFHWFHRDYWSTITTDKRDSKGPRSFALDSSGIRHLAHGTLAGIAVVIAMTGMVLIDVKTGVSISAIVGLALSAGGKRAYTRWVDGFGDALIDD